MDTVPERLEHLSSLFTQRSITYGDAYRKFGEQAFTFIGPVSLTTPEDFGRFAILLQILAKLARYSHNLAMGGHADSLDDVAVYAMMLQELDYDLSSKRKG